MMLICLQDEHEDWKEREEVSISEGAREKAVKIKTRLRSNCQSDWRSLRRKYCEVGFLCNYCYYLGITKCCNEDINL